MTKAKQAETNDATDTKPEAETSGVGLSDEQFDKMMERLTATVRNFLDDFDKRINRIERQLGIGTGTHE